MVPTEGPPSTAWQWVYPSPASWAALAILDALHVHMAATSVTLPLTLPLHFFSFRWPRGPASLVSAESPSSCPDLSVAPSQTHCYSEHCICCHPSRLPPPRVHRGPQTHSLSLLWPHKNNLTGAFSLNTLLSDCLSSRVTEWALTYQGKWLGCGGIPCVPMVLVPRNQALRPDRKHSCATAWQGPFRLGRGAAMRVLEDPSNPAGPAFLLELLERNGKLRVQPRKVGWGIKGSLESAQERVALHSPWPHALQTPCAICSSKRIKG